MIDPAELSRAIANRWDAIAAALGPERERVEYELLSLLRELDAPEPATRTAAVEAILALLKPVATAWQALVQALRDATPGLTKGFGPGKPAGFVARDRYTKFPVFYATDRARVDETAVVFGADRGELSYGVAEISVPDDPRMGQISRPRWWRLEFHEDPTKHLIIHDLVQLGEADFVVRARGMLASAPRNEALVFVHGYNVAFGDAVMRTAQMAYDLHFEGLAVMYSWPSEGAIQRYTVDETNVAWSRPRFAQFISLVRERLGAETVHVVAHSMGNRLLTETLAALAHPAAEGTAGLKQVVFAAPDVDAATFKDLALAFRNKAGRFTLYASSDDKALKASKLVHKYPRAGESGLGLVVTDSIDTIDVTGMDAGFLGHSYYGDNRSVLSDLFHLIRGNLPPSERFGLERKDRYGAPYWAFRA
jgi:esterase/lipase superfamily enzyme